MHALPVLRRAVTLHCPRCGGTRLFTGWFSMAASCALCGLKFERAQGYWVGAIYVNYAMTTVITVTGFFLTWRHVPMAVELTVGGAFAVLFPLWFFRWSRSLWLAFELMLNPEL